MTDESLFPSQHCRLSGCRLFADWEKRIAMIRSTSYRLCTSLYKPCLTHKQLGASPRVIPRPEISNPEFLHAGPTRPKHEVRCGPDLLRRLTSWLQATPQAATGCSDPLGGHDPIDAMHAVWRRPTGAGVELGLLCSLGAMCAGVVSAGRFGTPGPTAM